ncbi:MAG TPA: hypothetical protein VGM37_19425 [Armatimonadota bacterium]|jgi:hypothetical protein
MSGDDDLPDRTPEQIDPDFLQAVMQGLSETNFARGWVVDGMYSEFLAWCEFSEEADEIIAGFFPRMPHMTVDEEGGLRIIGLQASVATDLMKALLEAFEMHHIRGLVR